PAARPPPNVAVSRRPARTWRGASTIVETSLPPPARAGCAARLPVRTPAGNPTPPATSPAPIPRSVRTTAGTSTRTSALRSVTRTSPGSTPAAVSATAAEPFHLPEQGCGPVGDSDGGVAPGPPLTREPSCLRRGSSYT